jgi:hypothetical protein
MTRGIFDGFEGYQTPTESDFKRALTQGLVVPDTNVLLNLYRYTAQARNEMLGVLGQLPQLWVPHRVMQEFWQNREAVTRGILEYAKRTCKELDGERQSAHDLIRTWARQVSASTERCDQILADLQACFDGIAELITGSVDAESAKSAAKTQSDPVLSRLDKLLHGRIGEPIPEKERDAVFKEAKRRLENNVPPGYKDKEKGAARGSGDYILWEQTLRQAAEAKRDVVFVTGDVKEDLWRGTHGPRTELIDELRERAGARLFMVRPDRLLELARTALGAEVSEDSLKDVATVASATNGTSWTRGSIATLLHELDAAGNVQAAVIRYAAAHGGFVDRETVFEICDFPSDRKLNGFTRPVRRISGYLKDASLVSEDAVDVLEPVYDSGAWVQASGFRIPDEVIPLVLAVDGSDAASGRIVGEGVEVAR